MSLLTQLYKIMFSGPIITGIEQAQLDPASRGISFRGAVFCPLDTLSGGYVVFGIYLFEDKAIFTIYDINNVISNDHMFNVSFITINFPIKRSYFLQI